jgi:hypothetical protein
MKSKGPDRRTMVTTVCKCGGEQIEFDTKHDLDLSAAAAIALRLCGTRPSVEVLPFQRISVWIAVGSQTTSRS